MTAEQIAELKRWIEIANQPYKPRYRAAKQDGQAMVTRFAPALIAALEAAEAERDERTTMAARAQEAMRYLLNGLPATDAIWAAYGNADSARAWLAARDARMKALGAAEWLEHQNEVNGYVDLSGDRIEEEAAELRRKAGE